MEDIKFFEKWFAKNYRSFHCGQMSERQIAYASFVCGMNYRRDHPAQEPAAASDGESMAVLEGVEYETHFNTIQNTVVLIRCA